MTRLPSRATVEALRERYQAGKRVELVKMNDAYTKIAPGTTGTVQFVDSTGTIFVKWDNGSSLGVIYGEDRCRLLN